MTPRRQSAPFRPPGRSTGWRYERLGFVLAGLTVAVTAGVQISGKASGAPSWLFVLLYGGAALLAGATALVKLRSAGTAEDRKWVEQVQQLLAVPPTEDGQLRRLSTLSPYRLGVSPSRYGSEEQRGADPYVRRTADDELDRALRDKPFVLVVGDSKAGKSRTAYEAARGLGVNGRPHDPKVLAPKNTAALAPLLNLDPPLDLRPAPALLWLDDLTEGELDELSGELLDRLQHQQVRILVTITAQRYGRIEASDTEIGRTARQALNRACVVLLDSELTETERAAAQAVYPAETFQAGIGEQLVAAEKLVTRYDTARRGGQPHGWAVVQTAIDWVRMDIGRPIRRSELASLYPIYLRQVRPTDEPRSDLSQALEWARTAVGSRIALLQPATDDTEAAYLPFDYLVALADGQHGRDPQPIPDDTWSHAACLLTPTECNRAGTSAYYRRLPGLTRTLLLSAIESGDRDEAPRAMFGLGNLLAEQGDVEGAQDAYQRAIDSAHPHWKPAAMVNLGLLLAEQGDDVEGARAAFQWVIESGHAEWRPRAKIGLGLLLDKQGDVEGARAAFQWVIDSGHPEEAPAAMGGLGDLLAKQGDVKGARAAYQRAIDTGHPEQAPYAMFGLGVLLDQQGDVEGARAAYQRVIDSGDPAGAPRAMVNLGALLAEQGDVEGARTAYQRAIDTGHPEQAPKAMVNLGALLDEHGDVEGARAAFQQAIDSAHPDEAPRAMGMLGVMLEQHGDVEGAQAAFQRAIDSAHPDEAPVAMVSLGVLLAEQGDVEGARAAYQQAIDSGHPYEAPTAMANLGALLAKQGDVEGALAAYRQAIDFGQPRADAEGDA